MRLMVQEHRPFAPLSRLYRELTGLVESKLWLRVLLGLVAGAGAGALLGKPWGWLAPRVAGVLVNWIALPGDLFIRLVQMIMIPLIVASIIQGIAGQGERRDLARLGARVGLYFLATTVVAIVLGLVATTLIHPGRGISLTSQSTPPPRAAAGVPLSELPALLTGLLPANPLQSMLAGEMLSIVLFAAIVGAALVTMPRERAEPTLALLTSVQEICMTVTKWAMRLAPLAVFGLMARTTARSGLSVLAGLGLYVLTVLCALLVLLFMNALLIGLVSKVRLVTFFRAAKDVLLLAFSVASSAAVMPLSMKTAEEELQVPPAISRFVIPLGAVVNMNGTAAYQAVATVFLAQVYGMELGLATMGLVVVTAVAASIGTPSAPGGGIIVLAGVLSAAGVPAEGISVIIGVDYLLGMCRTAVNVAGDLTACALFRDTLVEQPASSAPTANTQLTG